MEMAKEEFGHLEIMGITLEVSNTGRVFKDGIEVRQNENHDGYLVVYVGNNRSIGVHRLVALTFIHNDQPDIKNDVNHKDFDRKNNNFLNLEWLSHSDNVKYSHASGRYKKRFGKENANYGNRALSKFYSENPNVALEKQSRKGNKNGKAKPIDLYKEGELVRRFDYIGDCCKYLHEKHGFSSNAESIRCAIRNSIKHSRPYKGFTFVKH
jgi:hypothetical protein